MEYPLKLQSINVLCDLLDTRTKFLSGFTKKTSEAGCIYNSLPIEFFVHYPTLMKFMLFKWGHYFVGTEEFNDFNRWRVPPKMAMVVERIKNKCIFDSIFYVWDRSLIWTLVGEIDNFCKMHVMDEENKTEIKKELKDLLSKLEQMLNGTYVPYMMMKSKISFYVSMMNFGFSCCYYASETQYSATFATNFSYSPIDSSRETFEQIKEWVKSLRNISTLLSDSGRIERRLFFEDQQKIVDELL